ncbi:MAG: phosphoribosyltransferase [Pseudomonadota bacterium]
MSAPHRAPWADITHGGHAPSKVHSIVTAGVDALPDAIWNGLDLAVVVLRGGALLEAALGRRQLNVARLRAGRREAGVVLTETPVIDSGLRRLLICDVLCDTGSTLVRCAQWARQAAPEAQIDLLCIYSTEVAHARLSGSHRVFSALGLGHPEGDIAPADIPYDFGDVAAECGLL